MLNTIRTDAIQHGADYFLPPQQCLQQAREALIYSRGCTWLILFPGAAPLAGNGHFLAKSGNKAREQKQPSPEGVRQQAFALTDWQRLNCTNSLSKPKLHRSFLLSNAGGVKNQRFPRRLYCPGLLTPIRDKLYNCRVYMFWMRGAQEVFAAIDDF